MIIAAHTVHSNLAQLAVCVWCVTYYALVGGALEAYGSHRVCVIHSAR